MQCVELYTPRGRVEVVLIASTKISLTVDHLSLRQQYYFKILSLDCVMYVSIKAH